MDPPPPPALENIGVDCWWGCGRSGGACPGFCGAAGACCRRGADRGVLACGDGSEGCGNNHCCTAASQQPPPPPPPPPPFIAPSVPAPPPPPWLPYVCDPAPCAASSAQLLGDVARTTIGGIDARTGATFFVGENIFGPFENGFGTAQNNILRNLGCADPSLGHVQGGIDTFTAEQMIAHACGVTLPRVENAGPNGYISLLDECGGHTSEYHFHESLRCLYDGIRPGHSTKVGETENAAHTPIYGKFEDYSSLSLPALDACGAHFGVTPDSNGLIIYHHHVSDLPPFTVGCHGPAGDPSGHGRLVSLAACRALYPQCGDGDDIIVTTAAGSMSYDPWCPCFIGGSNV